MTVSTRPNRLAEAQKPEAYRAGILVSLIRLRWFILLRWGLVLAGLSTLVLERVVTPEAERPGGLLLVILAIGVVNVGWTALSKLVERRFAGQDSEEPDAVRTARLFANAQVALDLFFLTAILQYTGGIESPMAVFYVFHMVIGSLLLDKAHAIIQGVWALGLYALIGIGELQGWFKHYEFLPLVECGRMYAQPELVFCTIFIVGCGIFGTLYLTLTIAGELDDRESRLRAALVALQQSKEAIQELQSRRAAFMQTAAHQLKGPLAAIEMLAGLVREGTVSGDGAKDACGKIIKRCRDGAESIGELLTLARIQDADPRREGRSDADLGEVVSEVCNRRKLQAEQSELAFEWSIEENVDLHAPIDRLDLNDCVENLVENAIKYTPGPGTVKVSVSRQGREKTGGGSTKGAAADGDSLVLKVSDTGIGINPEELAGVNKPGGAGSVFDAFKRGSRAISAGIPGSGLGLSIVRAAIERAGGTMHVESEPGKGSVFSVTLPAAVDSAGRRKEE